MLEGLTPVIGDFAVYAHIFFYFLRRYGTEQSMRIRVKQPRASSKRVLACGRFYFYLSV